LEELWKVNKGVTFTGQSSGVFGLCHALLGMFVFWKSHVDAHFLVGVFAGTTLCAALLSLNMVYVWGAETNLLYNLKKLNYNNKVFDESGRHMVVDASLETIFFKLTTTSVGLCLLQIVVLVSLVGSQKEFIQRFRLLKGIHNNEETMAMISSHHQQQQFYGGESYQNGGSSSLHSETMPLRSSSGTTSFAV